MKRKSRHDPRSNRTSQTGIRRRYIEAIDIIRADFPRKSLMNHGADWYTDGHLIEGRPLFSILSLSNYAEYLAYHLRFGRTKSLRGTGEKEVLRFFFATRDAMFFVLKNIPSYRGPKKNELENLRKRVSKLVDMARAARLATRGDNDKEAASV